MSKFNEHLQAVLDIPKEDRGEVYEQLITNLQALQLEDRINNIKHYISKDIELAQSFCDELQYMLKYFKCFIRVDRYDLVYFDREKMVQQMSKSTDIPF